EAGRVIREVGYQSRPLHLHAIDLATHTPHIGTAMPGDPGAHAEEYELVIKPGMELMLEPNPITLDGRLGLFLGHTFLITETRHTRVTGRLPLQLLVAGA
ncbi:MAG: hypothetical protein ACXWQR_24655, partial [Ktedonobacterales bacterium]